MALLILNGDLDASSFDDFLFHLVLQYVHCSARGTS
jgi:hypothetical protein